MSSRKQESVHTSAVDSVKEAVLFFLVLAVHLALQPVFEGLVATIFAALHAYLPSGRHGSTLMENSNECRVNNVAMQGDTDSQETTKFFYELIVAVHLVTHPAIKATVAAIFTASQIFISGRIKKRIQQMADEAEADAQFGGTNSKRFHGETFKPLNLLLLVVGTRGDVQPFIGIGLKLKEYGHRVRIASHKMHRDFVTSFGLEFYPIGGDPKVLSEFVVKHHGIMPGLDITDALEQQNQVKEIVYSTWGACVYADPEGGPDGTPGADFVADAIIANPPSFGHLHCAERLDVPLHIVFTMPWSPTTVFPQPFARIKINMHEEENVILRKAMNWHSYFAVERFTWIGIKGYVYDFRMRVLGLKTWDKRSRSHGLHYSKTPFTYIYSPALANRPSDWPEHLEVTGFINVAVGSLTKYEPPKELKDFLDAGPPPIYIGFGSLVMPKPDQLTRSFLDAIAATGVRAIIQEGWGGLGAGVKEPVKDVLFIKSAAHDWLFEQCCAVVHHGGAGTTATGLYAGKPTFIVPFFGDQPFWGAAVFDKGAGPAPVEISQLTTKKITEAFTTMLKPECIAAAQALRDAMLKEDGVQGTVDHIHRTIFGTPISLASALSRLSVPEEERSEDEEGGEEGDEDEVVEEEDDGVEQEEEAMRSKPSGIVVGGRRVRLRDLSSWERSAPSASEPTDGWRNMTY